MGMAQKKCSKETVEKVKKLFEREKIEASEEFFSELIKSSEKFYSGILPGIGAFENVIKAARYWESYCKNKEEFFKLVRTGCLNMAKIRACVIGSVSDTKAFIGNTCELSDKPLPECSRTIAAVGKAVKCEGWAALEEKI